MALELDHIFCMMDPDDDWGGRLERAGWALDAGTVHAGQGTRNRRLVWPEHYLELAWVFDYAEARTNPVRLDRRANWRETGASPFGFGLRGRIPEAHLGEYWMYEGLGMPIWIHCDNDRAPDRPLVFVLPTRDHELERHRPRTRFAHLESRRRLSALRSVRVSGPSRACLPTYAGPPIDYRPGPHRLELELGEGPVVPITDILVLAG